MRSSHVRVASLFGWSCCSWWVVSGIIFPLQFSYLEVFRCFNSHFLFLNKIFVLLVLFVFSQEG